MEKITLTLALGFLLRMLIPAGLLLALGSLQERVERYRSS